MRSRKTKGEVRRSARIVRATNASAESLEGRLLFSQVVSGVVYQDYHPYDAVDSQDRGLEGWTVTIHDFYGIGQDYEVQSDAGGNYSKSFPDDHLCGFS